MLAGANYGLLDEQTLEPRPDYFASVLWKRLMGTRVLAVQVGGKKTIRVYAHCAVGGGVTVLVINVDSGTAEVTLPVGWSTSGVEAFALTAPTLDSPRVSLNGNELFLVDGGMPDLVAQGGTSGMVNVTARSAIYLRFAQVELPACR